MEISDITQAVLFFLILRSCDPSIHHRGINALYKSYIYSNFICATVFFFIWLHSSPSETRACARARTHTHTHSLLVHPLIPNCLRKRRGEIPLQCVGSALFGAWRRTLRSGDTLPDTSRPCRQSALRDWTDLFSAQTEHTCEQQELPRSIMGNSIEKFACLDSDVIFLFMELLCYIKLNTFIYC